MNNEPNNIEDLFRKAFEGRELPVTDTHWNAIAAGMAKRKRRIAFWWFAAAILFLGGTTAGLVYSGVFSKQKSINTAAQTEQVKTSTNNSGNKIEAGSGATTNANENEVTPSTTPQTSNGNNSQSNNGVNNTDKINPTVPKRVKQNSIKPENGKVKPVVGNTKPIKPVNPDPNPVVPTTLPDETLTLASKTFSKLPVKPFAVDPADFTLITCLGCKKIDPPKFSYPGIELQFGLGAANNGAKFNSSNEPQLNTLRATDKNLTTISPYVNLRFTFRKVGFGAGLKHLTFGEKTNYDYRTRNVKAIPHLGQNGQIIGYFYLPGINDTTMKKGRRTNVYRSVQMPLFMSVPVRIGHRGYLQISGGPTLGYVYKIDAVTPYRFHNVPGSNFLQDPTSLINRFQMMGTLGVEYLMPISKNWMFSTAVQGNMQLNTFYVKSSGMTQFNRNSQLNFGLVYKIK